MTTAWRLLRPRTIAQTQKHVDDLRSDIEALRDDVRELRRALAKEIALVGAGVTKLANKEAQLRALAVREIELENRRDEVERITADSSACAYIRQRVSDAAFPMKPFPHLVVDNVLPKPLYDTLITGLPPVELFNEQPRNKQQLTVPFKLAPWYTRSVWTHLVHVVVPTMLTPALIGRFGEVLDQWVRQQFPAVGTGVSGLEMVPSDGRILLRTRGYEIPPHRDPKWGFITCILYLARRGDSSAWGTQLYEVDGDEEARGAPPHWIEGRPCRQVKDVPFVPNRALVFLNSAGAHGASIPESAPEGIERYIYQFRVGPSADSIGMLMSTLPEDRRALWAGKLPDY